MGLKLAPMVAVADGVFSFSILVRIDGIETDTQLDLAGVIVHFQYPRSDRWD